MILIHTALYSEAKPIIQYFKLIQYNKHSGYKLYKNDEIVLIVCGIGKNNTQNKLPFVFETFKIEKAFNIGICGCKDESINIAEVFSLVKCYDDIEKQTINTLDAPCTDSSILDSLLVDMEFKYFYEICLKYVDIKNIESFKIVSDHLSDKICSKDFVEKLIENSICKWYNKL